jgi:hypothetical protein
MDSANGFRCLHEEIFEECQNAGKQLYLLAFGGIRKFEECIRFAYPLFFWFLCEECSRVENRCSVTLAEAHFLILVCLDQLRTDRTAIIVHGYL